MSTTRSAMTRPGRADITKMRSARNTASRRSCVTSTIVILRAACRSRMTHHSSSRVKASSAPNGSSSISSSGSWISARQSEVRCCMPPESCQGYLSPWPREADRGEQRLGARDILGLVAADAAAVRLDDLERQQQVFQRRAPRQQRRRLERHAGDLDRLRHDAPATCTRPLEGKLQAGRELHQGGLAAAGRADHRGEFAAVHVDREAIDRERAAGAAVDVADVVEGDEAAGSRVRALPLGHAGQSTLRSASGRQERGVEDVGRPSAWRS